MHCVVTLYEFYEPSQVYINVLVQPTKALFSPVAEGCRALFPLSSSFPGFKDHIACDIITLMLFHFISLLIFHEFHTSMDIPKDYFLAWTCLYYYLISFFSSVSVPAVILYKLTFKLFRYGLLRLCFVTGWEQLDWVDLSYFVRVDLTDTIHQIKFRYECNFLLLVKFLTFFSLLQWVAIYMQSILQSSLGNSTRVILWTLPEKEKYLKLVWLKQRQKFTLV